MPNKKLNGFLISS